MRRDACHLLLSLPSRPSHYLMLVCLPLLQYAYTTGVSVVPVHAQNFPSVSKCPLFLVPNVRSKLPRLRYFALPKWILRKMNNFSIWKTRFQKPSTFPDPVQTASFFTPRFFSFSCCRSIWFEMASGTSRPRVGEAWLMVQPWKSFPVLFHPPSKISWCFFFSQEKCPIVYFLKWLFTIFTFS